MRLLMLMSCSKCSLLMNTSLRIFHSCFTYTTINSSELFAFTNCIQQRKLFANLRDSGVVSSSLLQSSCGSQLVSCVAHHPVKNLSKLSLSSQKHLTKGRTVTGVHRQNKFQLFLPQSSMDVNKGQGKRKRGKRKERRSFIRTSYGRSKMFVTKKKPKPPAPPMKISKGDQEIIVEPKIKGFQSVHHGHDPCTFNYLELREDVIEGINNLSVQQPTVMQMSAIPRILAGENIFCAAQTGSGKTLAYVAPLMHLLKQQTDDGHVPRYSKPRILVVAPSKELCSQILSVFRAIATFASINAMGFVGGLVGRKKRLKDEIDVLIGTPDDILKYSTRGWVSYSDVQHLVFDEADTLADEGFRDMTLNILLACQVRGRFNDSDRSALQCVLTSATMPNREVLNIYRDEIPNLDILQSKVHHLLPHVRQIFIKSTQAEKPVLLLRLLEGFQQARNSGRKLMVFCNKSTACNWLSEHLTMKRIEHAKLHRGVLPDARAKEFQQFRHGHSDILLCTDLASRGLDFTEVMEVVNFDCPFNMKDYLHRAGRTGRAHQVFAGVPQVTTFITRNKEVAFANKIQQASSRGEKLADIRDKTRSERERYELELRRMVLQKLPKNVP